MLNATCVKENNFSYPKRVSYCEFRNNFHTGVTTTPQGRRGTHQRFYLPTDAQQSCFKRKLKFTLKQLLHISVQSPSSGSVLFELAEVIVIKIIS